MSTLSKIEKLEALANDQSTTEHERNAARRKADQLAGSDEVRIERLGPLTLWDGTEIFPMPGWRGKRGGVYRTKNGFQISDVLSNHPGSSDPGRIMVAKLIRAFAVLLGEYQRVCAEHKIKPMPGLIRTCRALLRRPTAAAAARRRR